MNDYQGTTAVTMSPKQQFGLALLLLLIVFPALVGALIADIRSGRTKFASILAKIGRWRPWGPVPGEPTTPIRRRDTDPGEFWQQIIIFAAMDLIPLAVGILLLRGAVHSL